MPSFTECNSPLLHYEHNGYIQATSPLNPSNIILELSLDISGGILAALETAAQFAPVPCLREAAGLALAILNAVQGAKYNKDAFTRLAYDACAHVHTVLCLWEEQDQLGIELSPGLRGHLRELLNSLTNVHGFAHDQATRSWFLLFVLQKSDIQKVQEYRERLKQALDVFMLQSNITIRETVIRILRELQGLSARIPENAGHSITPPLVRPTPLSLPDSSNFGHQPATAATPPPEGHHRS